MIYSASAKAAEEEKTDSGGAFLAREIDAAENLSASQSSLLTQTFVEHAKLDQLDALSSPPIKGVATISAAKREAFGNTE